MTSWTSKWLHMPQSVHYSSSRYDGPCIVSSLISLQASYSLAFASISQLINDFKQCIARNNIAKLPGCVKLTPSSTGFFANGIAKVLSMRKDLFFILIYHHNELMQGLVSLSRVSSFWMTQSRTSFIITS